jgi:DNA-binding CsgD family transcriptional regulator
VVEKLVPALSVEAAAIRLLDRRGLLHLVGASGFVPSEVRKLALAPIELPRAEAMIASGAANPLASSHGIAWLASRWLETEDRRLGTITLATRSERRPSEEELAVFATVSAQLAKNLRVLHHPGGLLRARSLEFARQIERRERRARGPAALLRARELTVLELYEEGLTTREIAELLVISQHTVRTHVKLALARLGVRSRAEAVQLVAAARHDTAVAY